MEFRQSVKQASVSVRVAMESDMDCETRGQSPLPPKVQKSDKDFVLKFRSLVELWDNTHPEYTNKYKRNEHLAKLLPILRRTKPHATINDVKRKINTIRTNYKRELRKMQTFNRSYSGTNEVYTPKVWYFQYLNFLTKLNKPGPKQQQSEPTYQSQSSPETTQQTAQETTERSFSYISTDPEPSFSGLFTAKIERTYHDEYSNQNEPFTLKKEETDHDEYAQQNFACQYVPCTQMNQQENVPQPIALEWSNTLDRLDPVQRLYAKKAINDILFEAELGNLKSYSVRINDSCS